MKFRNLRRKVIDDYAVIPFLLCGVGQLVTFYLVRVINRLLYGLPENYHNVTTRFDDMIPLVPWWVLIYIFAYVFWLVSYLWVSKESKEMSCRFLTADMIGKVLCFVIFIAFPTTNIRTAIPTDAFAEPVLRLIYFLDSPDNLFPSMHCSVSWFALRYVLKCKKIPVWYKIFSFITTFAIFLSVLFTKQHVLVDIFGGIAVAEIGILLGDKTGLYKIFFKTEEAVDKFYERYFGRKNRGST